MMVLILILFIAVIAALSYGVVAGWMTFGRAEQAAWTVIGCLSAIVALATVIDVWSPGGVPFKELLQAFTVLVAIGMLGVAVVALRSQQQVTRQQQRWSVLLKYIEAFVAAMSQPFWASPQVQRSEHLWDGWQYELYPFNIIVYKARQEYETQAKVTPNSRPEYVGLKVLRPCVRRMLQALDRALSFVERSFKGEEQEQAYAILLAHVPWATAEFLSCYRKFATDIDARPETKLKYLRADERKVLNVVLKRLREAEPWAMETPYTPVSDPEEEEAGVEETEQC